MLERFGMQDCKPCKTPAGVHFKKDFLSAGEILSEEEKFYLRRTVKDVRASLDL
jgi:hypothetical protein